MSDNYITIKQEVTYEQVINKSRFITSLYPVSTEDEAKAYIALTKDTHKGANHNCSAYTLGTAHQIQKANDDGEPSGTAGVPMLETLKKEDVHNVVAIVTRYFGGVKLGTGGLIRAYQSGITEAVRQTGKVSMQQAERYLVTMNYEQTGKFDHFIDQTPYDVIDKSYTDKVTYTIHITAEDVPAFESFVSNQTNGQAAIKKEASLMLPFDL
ncbi:YigZ family protein [Macrococcus equipercicus]|uniref:YigZ family protein n=1 Tax=Macrococcus equipercicus TaxID=69967 RepID=A0A9Q9F216_9STAP|nr:YigZ family protein [Macrococcus equipercicus]KAA1042449.1 YigZ family protein [Macrococcus equipercicus]UTH14335.1 YigZ family protein [Macrococcus equipercicus]